MRPVLVFVADVFGHQPLQMPYVQNSDGIPQISSAVFHPAFGDAVLSRASEVGLLVSDAEALYRADNLLVEVRSSIEDQIVRRCIVRKCFAQLLRDPQTTWMPGDIAVENPASVVCNDEEAVQDAEGQRRHGKEIHRCNRFSVSKKATQRFANLGFLGAFRIQRDTVRSNMSSRAFSVLHEYAAPPGQVLGHNAEDEFAQFFAYTPSSRTKAANRGCGWRTFKTASCCRRASFSRTNSRRERRSRIARTGRSFSRQSMSQHEDSQHKARNSSD
jgi:hypothetical protein